MNLSWTLRLKSCQRGIESVKVWILVTFLEANTDCAWPEIYVGSQQAQANSGIFEVFFQSKCLIGRLLNSDHDVLILTAIVRHNWKGVRDNKVGKL